MADLRAMFAKKQEAPVESPTPAPAPAAAAPAPAPKVNPFANKVTPPAPATLTAAPPTQTAAPTKLGAMFGKPPAAPTKPAPAVVPDSLDSLADLDSLANLVEPERPTRSQFPDETPASAPTRELPPELDKAGLQFVELIDNVYGIVHDPELLGNVIRSIMVELKKNPQYIKLVAREDVRTWVRAMRDSMGLARIKKQEKKSSRGTGRSSSKAKSVDDDMLKDLESLGIDLDNL